MIFDAAKLYNLLPSVYRLRDQNAAPGVTRNATPEVLQELLEIIADQAAVLQDELEQMYDNEFVETAAPWVLPYLGDLLGIRGLDAVAGDLRYAPRAEVANTIAYRRRKGTAAMLEQLARDITGRPAAAVEFWERIAATQNVNNLRPGRPAWASIRDAGALEFIDTPFETVSRTVEVRRIEPGLGKWNIPNVGLFIWRLQDFRRTRSPLVTSSIDASYRRLHPLGMDASLCAHPDTENAITHLAEKQNVPVLLTRRLLTGKPLVKEEDKSHPSDLWYGPDRSVQLWQIKKKAWRPVDASDIVVCDLHDVPGKDNPATVRWGCDDPSTRENGKILLDPVLGRVIASGSDKLYASYYAPGVAHIGGGEYSREESFDRITGPVRFVTQMQTGDSNTADRFPNIAKALKAGPEGDVTIQVCDSGYYSEKLPKLTANGISVELRAEDGCSPVVALAKPWRVDGDVEGVVTLNGLLMIGENIVLGGDLRLARLRHCTLLPGLEVGKDGHLDDTVKRKIALKVLSPSASIEIEDSVVGPLHVGPDVRVRLRNCIVDAGGEDEWAIKGLHGGEGKYGGIWRIENCTIIGRTAMSMLELASNTIFMGTSMIVQRCQEGCVRFSWLPGRATTPHKYMCVPRTEKDRDGKKVTVDSRPEFISLRYGNAGFCQLRRSCPDAIRRGADDESEMGVFHDQFEPRREAYLRRRLTDYLRFGLEAGFFYEENTPKIIVNK